MTPSMMRRLGFEKFRANFFLSYILREKKNYPKNYPYFPPYFWYQEIARKSQLAKVFGRAKNCDFRAIS